MHTLQERGPQIYKTQRICLIYKIKMYKKTKEEKTSAAANSFSKTW